MDGSTTPPSAGGPEGGGGGSRRVDVTAETVVVGSGTGASEPFAAGSILVDRYRLVALLGRGGMGEVWRADDLVLGMSVALKFLPGTLALDRLRLSRFREEVRLARQVAHPNVCRVHDITEMPGAGEHPPRVFISMEFVDGEDLASLLRRIGRLPKEKAAEVGRQICLGLGAAHEQGVVHGDLKPANVMLDGRGRVRLMDFGLASSVGSEAAGVGAGTPLYMAPEQFTGARASRRTDVYALGLVLYEVFTGRPAHDIGARGTVADLKRLHESNSTPRSMAALVADVDPVVERAIGRCLERSPESRPGSALAVAAALPGGDPLAAALMAGETPPMEMIAESGAEGSMSVRSGVLALGLAVVLMVVIGAAAAWGSALRHVPLPMSAEVLGAKAGEIARALGYTAAPADTASGFQVSPGYLWFVAERDRSAERWERLGEGSPAVVVFWHRQSPTALVPTSLFEGMVTLGDPAPFLVGSVTVMLDTRGRLVGFEAVPPAAYEPPVEGATAPEPDWGACFAAAGLKMEGFERASPARSPWHASDTRAAWTGVHPADASVALRVEAAAERGVVTSFRVLPPWSRPERTIAARSSTASVMYGLLDKGVMVGLLVMAMVLAWVSVRAGRGDRRGALRLAGFVLVVGWIGAAGSVEHAYQVFGLRTLRDLLAKSLWVAGVAWTVYIALEPVIRRHWPGMIVSWARAVDGRVRDPLVGRDLLLGSVVGLGITAVQRVGMLAPGLMTEAAPMPSLSGVVWMENARIAAAGLIGHMAHALVIALMSTFLIAGVWSVARRRWAGMLALGLLVAALVTLEDGVTWTSAALGVTTAGVLVATLNRWGTLAMAACYFTHSGAARVPFTLETTSWHASSMYAMAAVLMLPVAAGCAIAVRRSGPSASG